MEGTLGRAFVSDVTAASTPFSDRVRTPPFHVDWKDAAPVENQGFDAEPLSGGPLRVARRPM
jgi:hypothetical protein